MSTIMFPQRDLREETASPSRADSRRLSKLPWDGLSFAHPVPGLSLYRIVEPAGPFRAFTSQASLSSSREARMSASATRRSSTMKAASS